MLNSQGNWDGYQWIGQGKSVVDEPSPPGFSVSFAVQILEERKITAGFAATPHGGLRPGHGGRGGDGLANAPPRRTSKMRRRAKELGRRSSELRPRGFLLRQRSLELRHRPKELRPRSFFVRFRSSELRTRCSELWRLCFFFRFRSSELEHPSSELRNHNWGAYAFLRFGENPGNRAERSL